MTQRSFGLVLVTESLNHRNVEAGKHLWRLFVQWSRSSRVSYSRLLRTVSSWVLNIFMGGGSTTSCGSPFYSLTTLIFTSPMSSTLFVRIWSCRASPLARSLITCVRMSVSMHSRNLLDVLCSAVLSSSRCWSSKILLWSLGPVNVRFIPVVRKRTQY